MGGDLRAYLDQFEYLVKGCNLEEKEWCSKLYARLPEKLAEYIKSRVEEGAVYGEIKLLLLDSVGETEVVYGHKLFAFSTEGLKKYDAIQLYDHIGKVCKGIMRGFKTEEEASFRLIRAVLREHLPQNGKVFLEGSSIANPTELKTTLGAWMSTRAVGDFTKLPGSTVSSSRSERGSKDGGHTPKSGSKLACEVCGKMGHKADVCWFRSGASSSGSSSSASRTLTCFLCHKEGHRSFECPEKGKPNTSSSAGSRTVKKEGHFRQINVSMPSRRKRGIVRGTVNGVEAEILIDSGADLGVVPESMVPKDAYTGEKCMAEGALRGVHDVAKVSFGIADKVLERMAVVDRTGKCPPNCLFPLDVEDKEEYEWIGKVLHGPKPVEISQSVKILAVTTRAQARVEAGERSDPLAKVSSIKTSVAQQGALEEATHVEAEGAASAARPETEVVVEAGEGQSPAEESASTMPSGETQPNQTVAASEATLTVSEEEEESVATTNKPGLNEGGGVDKEEEWEKFMRNWTPIDEGDERSSYMSEVKEDESLKVWRELADRKEKGYRWRNGI